jgi:hypothetical protein
MNVNNSAITNKINPRFKPFLTAIVCEPKYVPSAIISLNHRPILYATTTNDKKIQ